jgi:predicted  nucleic acid-binding Zn-ribbon protein
MKKSIYTLALVTGTILMSCQTPAQKEEAAETKVQSAKEDLKDAKQELNSEYPSFRKDAELQINDNDKQIASLRAKLDRPGKHPLDNARKQRIDDLEKRNADLRSRLYGYETEHSDWAAFKVKFNHDKDNLRDAFKDFGDDLKK